MPNQTHDYGDLRVTLTSAYDWRWNDRGTGGRFAVTFYHPVSQGALCPLGSIGINNYDDINGKRATLLVGPNPNTPTGTRPAVARPTGYSEIWRDKGTGGKYDGTFWRPNAPSGYVSMGDVVTNSYTAPSTDIVWCMRSDLARRASYAASDFWNDENTGGAYDASCWEILPEPVGISGSENLPIHADTFRSHQSYSMPDLSIAFVPVLPVKNEFQKFQSRVPSVTPDTIPSTGDNFERKEQCRVILPFTAFISCKDARSLSRIQDPFCIMSRSIAWHVEGVWENGSGGTFSRERKIKYGVSRTQSEEMTHSAGVEVSATAGIGLVQSSIKLNYQFTDTNSRSFTEYTEQEVTQKFEVPPKHVTVLFSKHVWLKVTRGDGSEELSQIEMAANADVHFSGCSL